MSMHLPRVSFLSWSSLFLGCLISYLFHCGGTCRNYRFALTHTRCHTHQWTRLPLCFGYWTRISRRFRSPRLSQTHLAYFIILDNFLSCSSDSKVRALCRNSGEITSLDIPGAVRPGVLQSNSFATVLCKFSNSLMCFLEDWASSVVLPRQWLQLPFPEMRVVSLHKHH